MTRTNPTSPTTTVGTVNGNINNVEESTMSDKTGTNVIINRGDNYDAKATKVIPEAGIEQTFPDDNAALVFATRVTVEVLKGHAQKKAEDEPYAFMMLDNGTVMIDAKTVDNEPLSTATIVLSAATATKTKVAIKKRPIAATKPPVKKAPAKTVAPTKAPAVRKRPAPSAAPAAPARKTAPAKKAAPAAPRKTVAAAPAKAPARKTAPPAKKAPARKTAPSKK